jgi:hypothetical protein
MLIREKEDIQKIHRIILDGDNLCEAVVCLTDKEIKFKLSNETIQLLKTDLEAVIATVPDCIEYKIQDTDNPSKDDSPHVPLGDPPEEPFFP